MAQFDYPVPGQSLTTTPKNAPYERPPQITEPQEALKVHIDNLSKKESVEDIKYYIDMGLDVKSIVEALLRSAVAEGIHSIDISLIIAPLLHQIIVTLLDKMGIEYDEGISNAEEGVNLGFQRDKMRAKKMLSEIKFDESFDMDNMDLELTGGGDEMPTEEPVEKEPVKGLMARS